MQITVKEIEGPNQRKEVKETHPTPSIIKTIIKNQNNNNGRSYTPKKKLKQGSIFNKTKISKIKLNVLPINNI